VNHFELERPVLAVDVVIFIFDKSKNVLKVLLKDRDREPFAGASTLPGVAVRMDETLENAAMRALKEKTGKISLKISDIFLEQLAAFDAIYRDPRGRTISFAYMGLVRYPHNIGHKDMWKPVKKISEGSLPFDHNLILETALQRLKGKLRYTNIAGALLPESFRIEELQSIYEAILERKLNRSNFRNKLLKIGMLRQVTVLSDAVGKKGGRPPHLYQFIDEPVQVADRDFL